MPMSVTYVTVHGRLREETRGGVTTRYLGDTLGNVIKTTDESGNVTSETTYWPFGEVRTQTGTNPSPWGFCGVWGYLTDAVSRMYVRARHYRADTSRWLTVDRFWPHLPSYAYCISDPISMFDPSGLQHCTNASCTCGLHTNFAYWALPSFGDIIRKIGGCPQEARSEADNALREQSRSAFPGMSEKGDTARNAVNHCASACWASIKCGRRAADIWMNWAYETPDRYMGKIGDMVNNYKGFQCADLINSSIDATKDAVNAIVPFPMPIAATPGDCFACCLRKFRSNELRFL